MARGEEKLRLVLAAIDKTAAPIRKVNRRIEKMTSPVRKVKKALGALSREARFDKLARGARRLGKTLAKTATRAGGLALAAAAFVGLRFAKSGVEASAAYEALGVRLKVLTGNAEGARKVLEGIDVLAQKTPFSLEELGNVAASMSVIFKGNTERVSEFTALASDLAAAYGRPVEQIGENLQRAFSAGLGSADVLREAGITAEILKMTGATKGAELSQGDLAVALRKMVAEGGTAFRAAANQAATLDGSLSNTSIALGNVQRSLGDALAPLIQKVLLGTVIPAFERLRTLVEGNAGTIRGSLVQAVSIVTGVWGKLVAGFRVGLDAMGGTSRTGSELSERLSALGAVAVKLFDKFGGWQRVGEIAGTAIGIITAAVSALAFGLGQVLEYVDFLSPKISSIFEGGGAVIGKVVDLGGRFFKGSGSGESRGAAIAAPGGKAEVGGRISVELLDGRARIKKAETTNPDLELDLASGEALSAA